MEFIAITDTPTKLVIEIDKIHYSPHQIKETLDFLQRTLASASSIPQATSEEQAEIEAWLESIPNDEKETAFTRVITIGA
jgi:hypothetical protein